MKQKIFNLLINGINDGTVRPLKRTLFDSSEVKEAFQYMASGKHVGKILLKIRGGEQDNFPVRYPAIARTVFKPNQSYVFIGGLGGFGLELADWMIKRGALNIVLTSRSGIQTGYQKARVQHFIAQGVNVLVLKNDSSDLSQIRQLFESSAQMGTAVAVGGVFNLAMVLIDKLLINQTIDSYESVLNTKSLSTQNLDKITREVCPQLEYFICFSSLSCGVGHAGQTNYGQGNSIMERICEKRRMDGFPAQAIEWGYVGDVGVLADGVAYRGELIPQRMHSCLAALDILLQNNSPIVLSYVTKDNTPVKSIKSANIIDQITQLLGLKAENQLDTNKPLVELGIDSLLEAELIQILQRDYNMVLTGILVKNLSPIQIEVMIGQNIDNKHKTLQTSIKVYRILRFDCQDQPVLFFNQSREGKPLILLPPLIGSFDALKVIINRLNRPVIGLNWCLNCQSLKEFNETIDHFLKVLETNVINKFGNNFDIMGYSYGAFIAFYLAARLQEMTKCKQKLILLDGSPLWINLMVRGLVKNNSGSGLHRLIIMFQSLLDINSVAFKTILTNVAPKEQAQKIVSLYAQATNQQLSDSEIEFTAISLMNKSMMMDNLDINSVKFNGKVMLIRSIEGLTGLNDEDFAQLSYDYGLNQVVTGETKVFVLDGDHYTFLKNAEKMANLIETFLQN